MQSSSTILSRGCGRVTRSMSVGALTVLLMLTAAGALVGCSPPETKCLAGTAYVAYYYKYKEATPNESDIVYIEIVPPGDRCLKISAKMAPVFPGVAVTPSVKDGRMRIQEMDGKVVDIKGASDIAVYYDSTAKTGNAEDPKSPLAVEDLSGVSRLIRTLSVTAESPGCGLCPTVKCDGYACCKPPPCP